MKIGLLGLVTVAVFAAGCSSRSSGPVDTELAALNAKRSAIEMERDRRTERCLAMPDTVIAGGESPRGRCLRETSDWFAARMRELEDERLAVIANRTGSKPAETK